MHDVGHARLSPLDISKTDLNSMQTLLATAVAVLNKIVRKCHKIEQAYNQEPLNEIDYSIHGHNL